jgi:16S rRNA (adenine1518-N6/adenine1519-N6)-dimethyltransferase
MDKVRAKKFLGQHFLTDESIAQRIGETLVHQDKYDGIVEVGPGMGMMTKYVQKKYPDHTFKLVELDRDSVAYLGRHFSELEVLSEDFLKLDVTTMFKGQFAVVGNYPYNISSQIVFKVIDNRLQIPEMTGMFQKEVAERICEGPGTKKYGIISILVQAFYKAEYLFTVNEDVFDPPPKVKSGVIRLTRLETTPDCDMVVFKRLVKMSFNLRRKMLRKSLKSEFTTEQLTMEIFTKRPEQLSVQDFADMTNLKKEQ